MAQEAIEQLTTEWGALSDIITVDSSKTYYIQNRGADVLLAVESASEPTSLDGVLVKPYEVLKYQEGTDPLYLKAYNSNCSINITSEG